MKAKHIMVCGPSGGGKSTLLRQLHAEYGEASVFLTTKADDGPAATVGRYTRESARYPGDIQAARVWAKEGQARQVIVDEAQNAPTFTDGVGPLKDGLHEDRGDNVRWVVATQNPMDLHTDENRYGPIQQCEYWVFVGPVKDWHVGFFQGNNLNDLLPDMPTDPFEYVVIDPTASLSVDEKILYRGETEKKYA